MSAKPAVQLPSIMSARLRRRLAAQVAAGKTPPPVKKKRGVKESVTNWFKPFRRREDFLDALAKATAKHTTVTLTSLPGKEIAQRDIIRQIVRVHLDGLGLYPQLLVSTSSIGPSFLVKVTRPRLVLTATAAKQAMLFGQAEIV